MMRKRTVLAAAAAALFTAGSAGDALADHHEKSGDLVKCEGVNACKGHTACATAENECAGLNSCKGKGWVKMGAEECEKAKAANKS